jgi:hypothetical protein
MCTLSLDIDAFGADVGDPAVVNWIVNRLAGTRLTIADIVRSLSTRLNWAIGGRRKWRVGQRSTQSWVD